MHVAALFWRVVGGSMTLTLGMLEVRSSQFSGCFGIFVRQFSRHRYHEQYLLGMYQECLHPVRCSGICHTLVTKKRDKSSVVFGSKSYLALCHGSCSGEASCACIQINREYHGWLRPLRVCPDSRSSTNMRLMQGEESLECVSLKVAS